MNAPKLEKPSKELMDFCMEQVRKNNIEVVMTRQPPRLDPTWVPRKTSLRQEYEEGMRKLDPSWTPPRDDILIIDYISIL